jgi:hypothetical protein
MAATVARRGTEDVTRGGDVDSRASRGFRAGSRDDGRRYFSYESVQFDEGSGFCTRSSANTHRQGTQPPDRGAAASDRRSVWSGPRRPD